MSSSTDPSLVSSTTASRQQPHFFLQDPATRILWVLPKNTELGQRYAQLTRKDYQIAFMAQHGRNTGTLPPPEKVKKSKLEDCSDEYQALMREWKELGYLPGVDGQGNTITREEATRRRDEGYKAARDAAGS